jgi:trehalose 6-phosphate synthase
MTARRKLIVVSNRGPVSFSRSNGERVTRRGGGGLVTALAGLLGQHDVTWVASAMTHEDRAVAEENEGAAVEETVGGGSRYRLRLVAHDDAAYHRYYNVVSNPLLWFVHHGLWGLAEAPDIDPGIWKAWREGYVPVNRAFADAVCAELDREPGADVFFHDYHLYLAPAMVRERAPDATLLQFVHVPWPEPAGWGVLPEEMRRAIYEGLLANDVVSFHTGRWRANFLAGCIEHAGADVDEERNDAVLDGRVTGARCSPISVDPDEFAAVASSAAVLAAERELFAVRPEVLVVRVDRTDPSKNAVRGFRAFALYLEAHPEMHGRIGMLARLAPSRQDIPEYVECLAAIERAARAVNDRFARPGWAPVTLVLEDDFAASVAAYKQFDVLLVNPIADGLNLVAKEAPLVNVREGVVVLSETAGAHAELEDFVVSVNPFDVAGQAEAIHEAVTLGIDARRRRIEGIRARVREHSIGAWTAEQLRDLDEARARHGRTLRVP